MEPGTPVPTGILIFTVILLLFCGVIFALTIRNLATPNLSYAQVDVLGLQPLTKEPVSLTFNLTSPEDNILSFESHILVSGNTSPLTPIILSLNSKDQVITSTKKGDFSSTLTLQEGINNLTVSVFDTGGNKKTETRTIYYSKEKL